MNARRSAVEESQLSLVPTKRVTNSGFDTEG
ncbi:hypothetical protein JOD27_008611 [Lentzea nigeriaca]|nr:hypothetical protein [Lentzea nigeriaca]